MKKVKSTLLMVSLVFFALTVVGCAQTGPDTMGTSNMESSISDDTMDNSMNKGMDTMDAEKMDESMEKDMKDNMK